MKVALIDIGVSENEVENKMMVRHFSFENLLILKSKYSGMERV